MRATLQSVRLPAIVLIAIASIASSDSTGAQQRRVSNDIIKESKSLLLVYGGVPTADAKGAVIFLHGLGGNPFSTFTYTPPADSSETDVYWLDLLQKDSAGQSKPKTAPTNYHYFVFGYESGLAGPTRPVVAAQNLASQLRQKMTNYKRIVLVGHSLGGAISLDVYRLLFGMDTVTAKKVHAIFLAGTPSRGADLASYADRVSNALSFVGIRVDRSSIDAVKQYAPFVDEMLGNEAWRLEGAPVVYCSYELKGIPRFGTVVGKDKISSICQAQRTQGIGADHFGLVKPKNREVDSYVWLRDALTNLDAERNRLYANGIDRDPRAEALARLRTAKALIAHLEQFLSARQGPITQAERGQIQKDIGVLHAVVKSLEP